MPPGERDELGQSLFDAREAAGISQTAAADAAGLSQNKISRIEHKQGYLLKPEELSTLLALYGVTGEERRRIMAMAAESRDQHVDARVILQGGAHHFQERLRLLAVDAQLVRSFVPTAVIGYLQIPAYMQVVLTQRMTAEEAEPTLKSKVAQQALLDDPKKQWAMIQTEGALRWNIGGPRVMAEQVDRLVRALDRDNVNYGFIPWTRPVDLLPLTGFHIYDRRAVVVGTWSGTAIIRSTEGVEEYEKLFDRISALAAYGDEARVELRRIADEYRRLV